jgi:hypothetical protein
MHVHQFVVNEVHDTVYAVGHHRLATWELKAKDAKPAEKTPEKPAGKKADEKPAKAT